MNNAIKAALTEAEAAMYLSVSRSFLRQDRMYGHRLGRAAGPKWLKAGRMIRYRVVDLDAWLEARVVDGDFEFNEEDFCAEVSSCRSF